MARTGERLDWRKVAVLGALYVAQGLPYGFQTKALPVYLRLHGASLTLISLATLLSWPWMAKWLWAPLVDAWGSAAWGRRKAWLLPLQLLLAATCAAAAWVAGSGQLGLLLGLVAVMNLLAATQDIATDGLAVDLLRPGELGPGNAAQVVGYKLGTLLAGGGLLLASGTVLGWSGAFLGMAAVCLVVFGIVLPFPEAAATRAPAPARRPLREVLREVGGALRLPGTGWLLAFVLTYKLGETLGDVMFKPFLVDAGYGAPRIGGWDVLWGMPASILGSLVGGMVAARMRPLAAVGWLAGLRTLPLFGRWALAAAGVPSPGAVVGVLLAEEALGGALTTAMFAFMMARVDRRVGATHFTVLAAVEVAGKAAAGLAAGPLAQALGYGPLFAVGAVLQAVLLGVLVPLRNPPPLPLGDGQGEGAESPGPTVSPPAA